MTTPAVAHSELHPELPPTVPRHSRLTYLWYIGLGIALVYAGIVLAGGISDATDKIRHLDAEWIVPGLAAVALRFVLLGVQLRRLRGRSPIPDARLGIGIAFLAFGLGALMPAAPAEGFALSTVELHRRGMPTRRGLLMLAASQWLQFWSLIVVFAVDRLVTSGAGEIRNRDPIGIMISSVVLVTLCGAAFWVVRRPSFGRRLSAFSRVLPKQRHKSREERAAEGAALHLDIRRTLGSRTNRMGATTLAMSSLVADAAVLWCMLHAVRGGVAFEVAILAYVAATVVSWVPFLPNGLGLTEIAIPALLHHFGVPLANGLAGVLLWRVVAQGVPAVTGFLIWITLKRASVPLEHAAATPAT